MVLPLLEPFHLTNKLLRTKGDSACFLNLFWGEKRQPKDWSDYAFGESKLAFAHAPNPLRVLDFRRRSCACFALVRGNLLSSAW